jgi:signal transduction histidine kinase
MADIVDPTSLAAHRRLALMDAGAEAALDRMTRLAARLLEAPSADDTLTEQDAETLRDMAAVAVTAIGLRHSLAKLRHDFGQPLTVIQGFSELICDGGLSDAEIKEYAAEIFKEAAHLAELVARTRDPDRAGGGAPSP